MKDQLKTAYNLLEGIETELIKLKVNFRMMLEVEKLKQDSLEKENDQIP